MSVQAHRIPLLLALLLAGCAVQQPPSGGPRDMAPPAIVGTDPAQRALNVSTSSITIAFDDYVDRRGAQDAFFISPALRERPEFSWSGSEMTAEFHSPLRANTTYTVTIGTDVVRLREGVKLAKPYTLTFSTGSTIDTFSVGGRVYGTSPAGVLIYAYELANRNIDTLNPAHTSPDFVASVGKDSTFLLPGLPAGTLRLFAVRDEQRNLIYDIGSDGFGAARGDVAVSASMPMLSNVNFYVTGSDDTVRPEFSAVDAVGDARLRLTFSESIDTASIRAARIHIVDSLGHAIAVRGLFTDPTKANIILAFTDSMHVGWTYTCAVDSLRDAAGNYVRGGPLKTEGVAMRDTMPPTVVFPFRDTTAAVTDSVFIFRFSKPVVRTEAEKAFRLTDAAGHILALHERWVNDAAIALSSTMTGKVQWYDFAVSTGHIVDLAGNRAKDTTLHAHWTPISEKEVGMLSGKIVDPSSTAAGYVIRLTDVQGKRTEVRHVAHAGAYTLERIPDGTYTIDAFRDDNGNGVYSPGRILPPSRPAEPYIVLPNPVRIRARWTVEGAVISF